MYFLYFRNEEEQMTEQHRYTCNSTEGGGKAVGPAGANDLYNRVIHYLLSHLAVFIST